MTLQEFNKQILKLNDELKTASEGDKKIIYRKIYYLNSKLNQKAVNEATKGAKKWKDVKYVEMQTTC